MCKELVSIPWTSKPWVLSECHCLMPDYFVSNILSVCNLAVAWFEHNYSIPSLRKNSGWHAVYRALLIFPACFGSLGAILAILLLHVAFHGGAWQDFKGRKHLVLASLVRNACNGNFKENEVYKHSVETSHAPLCAGTVGQFHFFSCGLSSNWAHDTTEPFAFRAAKAPLVWHKSTTPADTSSHTSKESPPLFSSPQVMTTLVLKP